MDYTINFELSVDFMVRPTRLYIKKHIKSGMYYFGKTINDPWKYQGSGSNWIKHTEEYGRCGVITCWVSGFYYTSNSIRQVVLSFSHENDIVNSNKWANMIHEDGVNGGGVSNKKPTKSSIDKCKETKANWSDSERLKHYAYAAEQLQIATMEKYGVKSIFSIINKDEELNAKRKLIYKEIEHQKGSKNSQYGTMWITDGINNAKIGKDLNIPDGWIKGRIVGNNTAI